MLGHPHREAVVFSRPHGRDPVGEIAEAQHVPTARDALVKREQPQDGVDLPLRRLARLFEYAIELGNGRGGIDQARREQVKVEEASVPRRAVSNDQPLVRVSRIPGIHRAHRRVPHPAKSATERDQRFPIRGVGGNAEHQLYEIAPFRQVLRGTAEETLGVGALESDGIEVTDAPRRTQRLGHLR